MMKTKQRPPSQGGDGQTRLVGDQQDSVEAAEVERPPDRLVARFNGPSASVIDIWQRYRPSCWRRTDGPGPALLHPQLALHAGVVGTTKEAIGPGICLEADSLLAVGRQVEIDSELIDCEGMTGAVPIGDVHRNGRTLRLDSVRTELDLFCDHAEVAPARRHALYPCGRNH